MKLIPLSQGKFAMVDDQDYESLNQYKWHAYSRNAHSAIYAVRSEWIKGTTKSIRMHRQILNAPEDYVVDHKDHNGLNNQRSNIRLATKSQNQWNMKPYPGIKNIGIRKHGNKWEARIGYKGKILYLGAFKTESEAVEIRNKKATELHGQFKYNNFRD